MRSGLELGRSFELRGVVGAEQSVRLDPGGESPGPAVFSTPALVLWMELAAKEAMRPFLDPGEESVGVSVDIEHVAATPIGASFRTVAKVIRTEGKSVEFEVSAFDRLEQIGRGRHRRAVVTVDRLRSRLIEKQQQIGEGAVSGKSSTKSGGGSGGASAVPPSLATLKIEVAGPTAIVTLNRPEKLNAVNVQMTADWEQANAFFAARPDLRIVILTGAGRAFCAGDDVPEVGRLAIEEARALSLRQATMYLAWESLPQVFLAAVNGPALGGGCVAAYSCDFRIASSAATFGMPEIVLGWPPGYGVAQLTSLVGKARAIEMCLTGRSYTAQQAMEMGLVNRVVPGAQLLSAARQLAEELLAMSPAALRETKRLLHSDEGSAAKLAYLADTAAYIRCLDTADAREGIAAFREKRKAKFTGR